MLDMLEAKKLGVKAAGEEFTCPTGAVGRVLEALSVHGKCQAELSCTEAGCAETHVREQSDWHQCGKCKTHCKTKVSKKSDGPSLNVVRRVKLEGGEFISEMKILASDDQELQSLKAQNNAVFATLYAAEQATRDAEKAAAKVAREAKVAADKAAREEKLNAGKKESVKAQLERAIKLAGERGMPVSPTLITEAKALGIEVANS
jgi:hypothetical protein